jgi:filamentous hemagglutinin family protein
MKTSRRVPYRLIAHRFVVYLLVFCFVNLPVWALSGFNAVNGSANYNGSDTVSLNQLRAIIDWTDFNTNPGQLIQFLAGGGQLTSNHAVLNRVTGMAMTDFQGILEGGQGHILLINPQGITIGSGAVINAGRFTASTMHLQMSDQDFLDGASNFEFVKGVNDPQAKIALLVNSEINAQRIDLLAQQISNAGIITTGNGGIVAMATGDSVILGESGSNIIVELSVYDVSAITPSNPQPFNVINETAGRIHSPNGTIVMAAGDTFAQAVAGVQTKAYTANTYTASQRGKVYSDILEIGAANQADIRSGSTTTVRNIKIGAKKVLIEESLQSGSTMTIDSDYDITVYKGLESTDEMVLTAGRSVQVKEDIISQAKARIETAINHAEGLLSAGGDVIAEEELILVAESVLWGDSHQTIRSNTSYVESTKGADSKNPNSGRISKITPGNLYISAKTDVQLDGDVSAVEGGVSVTAETGKIHSGDGTNTLNVAISGYSDEITDSIGAELPDGEGKAAIVLNSHDTLNLGSDASLVANGLYLSADDDPDNGVDNRPDITFLDTDATEIGGHERDEGVASDVAIYVGSDTGNVNVATAQIEVAQPNNGGDFPSGPATVVFDSQDTVTMPTVENIEQTRNNTENGNLFRFRLEVVSRITEWLSQAVSGGKLPYAGNPEAVEAVTGQDYVLRGAGLDNPQITDGRIWVLEDPPVTPPDPQPGRPSPKLTLAPVAPLAKQELPELKGCPAEMEAAALELEINTGELQLKIQNSMASNPNIQPCDACGRLLIAAGALHDRNGVRYAAMVKIFNTLAPMDAPFTLEVSASVSTAFAKLAEADPQYALADDFIDSFIDYVAVLEDDLKTPIGDAMVFTLNKYGEAVMSNPNQNIVSYLAEKVQDRKNVQYVALTETGI